MVTEEDGDLLARTKVRIRELFESIRIIRDIVDHMPPGDLAVKVQRRIPEGETISRVEAPRGELVYHIISNGTEFPERVKVRTPSLCNWSSISSVAVGHKLADMPMLLVGIDPCFSCNDRMITVRRENSSEELSWEDIRKYGIESYK